MPRFFVLSCAMLVLFGASHALVAADAPSAAPESPRFSRHVTAVFSRLGCNGGSCHGAVQGKNGFRLSLFAAQPEFDFRQISQDQAGRRVSPVDAEQSLVLLKAAGQVPHGGGRVTPVGSPEYEILRKWLAGGAGLDKPEDSRVTKLAVAPAEHVGEIGSTYQLQVTAHFADGSQEDVTRLCSFISLDPMTAAVDANGQVKASGVGDAAIIARYRAEPAIARALIPRADKSAFPDEKPHNVIDEQILEKLKRLNLPPSPLADDAAFLRRVRLDVTGELPTAAEVREFLADTSPDKRKKKIDQLLDDPGYADSWALYFCDLLGASDFGVYADGLFEHYEAPRFQAWVRARLAENLPYDELAARVLLATSREGRSMEEWSKEVIALQEGYQSPRKDIEIYNQRKTLDIYWQRKDAVGLTGAMQVAHTFLGLRLECAQCHRHPHDVWQQDDLLSFANFFTRVRKVGFSDKNEKLFPEAGKIFKGFEAEGKKLADEVKKLKEGRMKELGEKAKKAQQDVQRLKNEIKKAEEEKKDEEIAAKKAELEEAEKLIAEHKAVQDEAAKMEKRGKLLGDEVAKRVMHSEILHRSDDEAAKNWASVKSPLGSQTSQKFRLLGETENLTLPPEEDPREKVMAWLRRPDNPFFARAIVNRIWAKYMNRGLIDPPDDLSPYNPATHPALLDELCRKFIEAKYDLKWLHRTILCSRTYQQSSQATAANQADRANYAYFYLRRLPAEVVVDALNQATGTGEDFDMKYYHWPEKMKTVEVPYMPKNGFVTFMLEQFGRSERNSAVQCDCERQQEASMLQILSLANHPRVRQKIADPAGRVATVVKEVSEPGKRIEELYLSTLGRMPESNEIAACQEYVNAAESPEKGLQGVLWSLLNTREFLLQH